MDGNPSWQAEPTSVQAAPPRAEPRVPGFLLTRIFGVEVRLDWSLGIIFSLVTINLGAAVLPSWHPTWALPAVWVAAATAAVLMFASLLAHELAHAFVARRMGVPVSRVTLFLFGGVAHMETEPPSPRAEFFIAVVGPLVSLSLGFLLSAGGLLLAAPALTTHSTQTFEDTLAVFGSLGPGTTLLLWLGPLNVMLGLFNLVPGFPLDGGRVLRSALWASTGDLTKATRWASFVGQAVAWCVMAWGLLNVLRGELAGGLWLGLIGWFLNGAARSSYQQLMLKQSLENVPVRRLMRTKLDRITPSITIEDFVRDHLMAEDQLAWPVEVDGRLVGLVSFEDLRKVSRASWPSTTVREVMTPASQLSSLPPDAGAERALEELSKRELEQLPVLEQGHLLGLIRRKDLLRWLALNTGNAAPVTH